MATYDTWNGSWGVSWALSWTRTVPTAVTGGHFIPKRGKRKASLSNIQLIYEKAKTLPRKETKELRDSIAAFVEPEIARVAEVPDLAKVDYAAIESNDAAYEKFSQALTNIQERLEAMEQNRIALLAKQEAEDDELLLVSIIASLIH